MKSLQALRRIFRPRREDVVAGTRPRAQRGLFWVSQALAVVVAISRYDVGQTAETAGAQSGGAKPTPGAGLVSLERLPDWSGWWFLDLPPNDTTVYYFTKAPFRAEVAEKLQSAMAKANVAGLKALQCTPPRFFGFSGGFAEDIEFLFTPGRVTITNESGLIRRIFTDPRSAPDEIERTDAGLSSGRWEGGTLIVETHSLNPDARFGANWPSLPKIGRDVRLTERISLRDANTLEIALTMHAPTLFTAPFHTTFVYRRDSGHHFHPQSDCAENDRSIDSVSGKERFDLTPPANLPPPPKD